MKAFQGWNPEFREIKGLKWYRCNSMFF